jgi:protein gp37
MNKTSIEWTDFTWNPVTGCHKISPGCKNCYAETLTNRFAKTWGVESFRDVVMHDDRLAEAIKNKKKWAGKKVFVCSMSDLFHDDVPFEFIQKIFNAFYYLPTTTFQILTKRPARALEFFRWASPILCTGDPFYRPVPNVWIGVSVEDQKHADERIPLLLQIPAAVRFLSCEPLLGPIDLERIDPEPDSSGLGATNALTGDRNDFYQCTKIAQPINWVIVGGESGHGARPMHPDWVRSIRDQCAAANVPFFFKQWGEWVGNQNIPNEYRTYNCKQHVFDAETVSAVEVWKLGKSKSGNMLDGKHHLQFPNPITL